MNTKMKSETALATENLLVYSPAPVAEMKLGEIPLTRKVTTSWDDGDPFDLRVAELLAARKLAGTFYLPVKGHHRYNRMSYMEMLELNSRGFEIGAHGVSHPDLPQCDEKQLVVEVESCKKRLEDDLGRGVSMFAYPRGPP
jgi:peptidoglycan/xylan/chitin deacetylase (PgdA/CDA1 family)